MTSAPLVEFVRTDTGHHKRTLEPVYECHEQCDACGSCQLPPDEVCRWPTVYRVVSTERELGRWAFRDCTVEEKIVPPDIGGPCFEVHMLMYGIESVYCMMPVDRKHYETIIRRLDGGDDPMCDWEDGFGADVYWNHGEVDQTEIYNKVLNGEWCLYQRQTDPEGDILLYHNRGGDIVKLFLDEAFGNYMPKPLDIMDSVSGIGDGFTDRRRAASIVGGNWFLGVEVPVTDRISDLPRGDLIEYNSF